MAITVEIDEENEQYRLSNDGDESGPIADIGDPAILISSEGVFYCLFEDVQDEPEVFCSTGAEPAESVTEDVTFIDNETDSSGNAVEVETDSTAD